MGELSEQNRALIERELGPYPMRALSCGEGTFLSPASLKALLDAARTEGRGEGKPVAWAYEYTNHLKGDRAPGGWLRAVAFEAPSRARVNAGFARNVQPLYASPIREPEISRTDLIKLLADHFGFRPYEQMAEDKSDLRGKVRDGYDVNEPTKSDLAETADAILNLAPVGGRGEGWRPIETAPKDGTSVLLFCPQGDGSPGATFRVTAGHWCSDPGGTTEYRDAQGRYIGQDDRDGFEGWLSWDGGFSEDTMMPTMWQPLPPPPQEQHQGGTDGR